MLRSPALVPLTLIGALVLAWATAARANTLGRDRDPVTLSGSSGWALSGAHLSTLVAFRFESGAGWTRIPVQVDERAVVDFGTIYHRELTGFTVLTYTDTSTFTGPDPDTTFDADDELVLMAKDAGEIATGVLPPAGTVAGSGVQIAITNPLTGAMAFAYLFQNDGSLPASAGPPPVNYVFDLLLGPYKTAYNTASGPNPENTTASSAAYAVHFADRWIRNQTRVSAGGASGADILDRHKALFAPGNCGRSEDTFSNGEGAFIVNREGPLRALRGYVGANSGPTTHRVHAFYPAREDILTVLRVHPIPGIMDFWDYSPDASGMTYRNDLNLAGVTIDGQPDAVTQGPIHWEMVTGPQGTVVQSLSLDTDIPGFAYTSYYLDDATPPVTQCTGDAFAYGSSGLWVNAAIPNTDPALGASYRFEEMRVIVYDAPGQEPAFAQARAAEAASPLAATATPYLLAITPGAPGAFRLAIGPHPVRDALRVRFDLPHAGDLSLRLFDITGRHVALLAEGRWEAGPHELKWDAGRLPTGIYLARATFAGERRVARLVHLR